MNFGFLKSRYPRVALTYAFSPWTSGPILALASFAIATAAAYRQLLFPPNHDVAWLLIAAGRIIDGGSYVSDIYEVNAPFAVLIYCPAVLLARLADLDPWIAFLVTSYGLIALSLVTANILLGRLFPGDRRQRDSLTLLAALLYLALPGYDFGQREHYAVVLLLPYVISAAVEDTAGPIRPKLLMIAICLAAAIGALIKPFFVLFPVAIFACRIIQERSLAALYRIDIAVFITCGLGFLILLFYVFPGWVEISLDTSMLYQSTYVDPRDALYVGAIGAGIAGGLLIASRYSHQPRALVILIRYTAAAALAAVVILLLQLKGWGYHRLPIKSFLIFSFGVFVLGVILNGLPARMLDWRRRWSVLAVYLLVLALVIFSYGSQRSPLYHYVKTPLFVATEQLFPGKPVFLLSGKLRYTFPWVFMQDRVWCSRFPSMWLLRTIHVALSRTELARQRDKLLAFKKKIISMMLADIERCRPAFMLVDATIDNSLGRGKFSYLALFQSEPALEALRQEYRPAGQLENFKIFALR